MKDGQGNNSSVPDGRARSEVAGLQAGFLGDPCQQPRADLLTIMICERNIGPTIPLKPAVRGAPLSFDPPAYPEQGRENPSGFCRGPLAHAGTAKKSATRSGTGSPCSTRSARTRNARALTSVTASEGVAPYTATPGRSGIAAIQRPSSSCSISIGIGIGHLFCQSTARRLPVERFWSILVGYY